MSSRISIGTPEQLSYLYIEIFIFLVLIVTHHTDQGQVEASRLTAHGKESKLDADTFRHAARPHLEAGVGIRTLHSSGNSVVPNVHQPVPAYEDPVKESDILKKGTEDQPINQRDGKGKDDETDAQADQEGVGRVPVDRCERARADH